MALDRFSSRVSRLIKGEKSQREQEQWFPEENDLNEGTNESTSDNTAEPVSERRREQIRRAQRLHRQRKAEHSKRLTAEIQDLRAKDVAKTARIDYLQTTVNFLSNLLSENGIAYEMPKPIQSQPQAQVLVLESKSKANAGQPQYIQVSIPHAAHVLPPTNAAGLTDTPVNLSDTQLGVDFILTLEHPCLYHHHGPAQDDDDLLGHSSLMQAPIMARAPPLVPALDDQQARLPSEAAWTVPSEELERLLTFSNQLRLPVEITPVQAWGCIQDRGSKGWMPSQNTLRHLLQDMRTITTCYGFGAVMEKAVFERLIEQYMR